MIDRVKYLLEKQNQIWVLLIGIVLIVYGIYLYSEISSLEESGQEILINRTVNRLYNIGGKNLLLALFEGTGIIALISGFLQLRKKL